MKIAVFAFCTIVASAAAADTRTFTGTISDDVCAKGDHSQMRMGSTDAECATACVSAHGAGYVLYDGKNVFPLNARQPLERFAGQKVRVTGVLDAKSHTIRVDSVERAGPARSAVWTASKVPG